MLDLSIIIVNYNKAEYLKQCLESIFDNVSQVIHFEVIVVDNNSTDSSCSIIHETFPDVILIKNSKNFGFAKANNQGLHIAKGKYLLLLNNDTFVLANSIERLIKFLHENPRIGAVGPALLLGDGCTIQEQGSKRGKKFWLEKRPTPTNFLTGAALMIRREVWEEVGDLDENFFFYNEDLDWCKRIGLKGWQIYYIPNARIIHYGGKSTSLLSEKSMIEGYRGGLYYCSKYYPWLFPIYRLLLALFCLISLPLFLIKILLWPQKINSFRIFKSFSRILFITTFWRYNFKKAQKERI